MTTTQHTSPKAKPPKSKRTHIVRDSASGKFLTGEALLKDMRSYGKKVASTPESAREFLTRLGVLDKNGKRRNLIGG